MTGAAAALSASYLTSIVAILGIGGTLAAALLTQRMTTKREERKWERDRGQDERRWEKELEREQIRWERERLERREQWNRESEARLLGERAKVYKLVLARIEELSSALSVEFIFLPDAGREELDKKRFQYTSGVHAAQDKLRDEFGIIRLFGSGRVVRLAETLDMAIFSFLHAEQGWDDEEREYDDTRPGILPMPRSLKGIVWQKMADLINGIRRDLGNEAIPEDDGKE
jgi:hypothetical protein